MSALLPCLGFLRQRRVAVVWPWMIAAALATWLPTGAWAVAAQGPVQAMTPLDHVAFGVFVGVALLCMAWGLAESFTTGDALGAWLAAMVLAALAFEAARQGWVQRALSDIWPAVVPVARQALAIGLAVAVLLFVRKALPPVLGGEFASRAAALVLGLGIVLAIGTLAFPDYAADDSLRPVFLGFELLVVVCVALLMWAARQAHLPLRRWYRTAFACAAVGVGITWSNRAGLVGDSAWVRQAMPLGMALAFAVLVYALALSVRWSVRAAGPGAVGLAREAASGFIAANELPQLLVGMALRVLRLKQPASVLMLQLANHDELHAELGVGLHDAIERAAHRNLRLAAREGDQLVRLDRTHYVMLLHQVQGPEDALALAERVRQLGLQHQADLQPLQHLHWHAAIAHLPKHLERDPRRLTERLLQLLAQIRAGSASFTRELA